MGHLGFSYVGLVYLLMLLVPNLIWAQNQPEGYSPVGEKKWLLILERVGEVCVTCCALIFSDFNVSGLFLWTFWLLASFVLMLLYECYWIRYFRGKHTLDDFYGSFLGIPVPGALLPVAAFVLLGVYGRVVWMVLSALVLGVGHIGIHLQHAREAK